MSGRDALRVKYIAKSPAKNISSDANHTTVPMATVLGRLRAGMCRPAGVIGYSCHIDIMSLKLAKSEYITS